jgi:hypothetical protein
MNALRWSAWFPVELISKCRGWAYLGWTGGWTCQVGFRISKELIVAGIVISLCIFEVAHRKVTGLNSKLWGWTQNCEIEKRACCFSGNNSTSMYVQRSSWRSSDRQLKTSTAANVVLRQRVFFSATSFRLSLQRGFTTGCERLSAYNSVKYGVIPIGLWPCRSENWSEHRRSLFVVCVVLFLHTCHSRGITETSNFWYETHRGAVSLISGCCRFPAFPCRVKYRTPLTLFWATLQISLDEGI